MADNKQYIAQQQDGGSVMVSEDVIVSISSHAASEVEGVASLNVKPGADIVEVFGKKKWGKGIKVTVDENNVLTIDCNIAVVYGQSVVAVAKAVQAAVTNAVEAMAGVKVAHVNVNVCGIVRQ